MEQKKTEYRRAATPRRSHDHSDDRLLRHHAECRGGGDDTSPANLMLTVPVSAYGVTADSSFSTASSFTSQSDKTII